MYEMCFFCIGRWRTRRLDRRWGRLDTEYNIKLLFYNEDNVTMRVHVVA